MLTKVARPIVRTTNAIRVIGARSYDAYKEKPVTLDDLPVPQGSWQEYHDAKQRKYNRHLILGVASLAISIYMVKRNVFFNYGPPVPPEYFDNK